MRAAGLVVLAAGLVAADRYTKILMMAHPEAGASFSVPGCIESVSHANHGIIANIPLPLPVTVAISLVVIGIVLATGVRSLMRGDIHETTALVFVLAGAVGNLWDRLQWQYVFDWILLFGRSAINLADICIGIGILWYVLGRRKPTLSPE
ncbi:signal peptidase II [Candidatus Uhrbacteria bacterium]|nr:signal peptidase II [Candidatus Uhrbacteria bacterium]